ncbi:MULTISPECIES: nuclear transport factor 2 family protein [unclassified Kribbella]|uniref:nuclear transport factor 2 family protein n=1 Tax=unclassified Kribbella TaxID=2644121 RepID=UPI003017FE1B
MDETQQTREIVGRYFETMAARDWDAFSEVLSEDVCYELPQTQEVISGREKYVAFNREYPGDWELTLTRVIVDGETAAGSMNFTVGDQELVGLVFLELRDGLVTRVTDFWPEPYEAPAGREHLVERAPAALDRLSIP